MSQSLGTFKCDHCPKRYKRIDYLIRHKRSHTQSKPYKCWTCFKSFARVDILKRHVAGHGSSIDIRSGSATQEANPCCQDPLTRPYEDSVDNSAAGTDFTDTTQAAVPLGSDIMSETGCLQPNSKSLEPDMACQDGSYVGIPDSGVSLGTWSLACSYQQDFSAEIGFSDVDLQLLDAFISTLPSGLYNPLPDTPEFWKSQESIETTSLPTTGKSNTDVGSPPHTLSQSYYSGDLDPLKHESERTDLASSSRNRILSALVQWGSEDIARIIEVLPSVGPLNALLQSYLTTPVAHANTFIHVATFNPNEKRADLLLAMLASSCILSSDATLNKLGRVFQECVLATLPKHFEVGNSANRDLELAQAFLITLEVGVWSGYMRTTEAAESFFQPLLTMIRRTGMLNHSSYAPQRDSGQGGMSLHERWLEWLHLESWKRLVCRVYKHDTNTSMALQVNPLISYAEFCLPLPASDDMWSAVSAEEWNSLFLAQQQNGSPQQVTLNDYLDDVEGIYVSKNTADLSIAREVFLSFAWGLSWEYIQLDRFQSQRPSKWNFSIMNSRYNELTEILDRCYRRPNRDDLFLLNSELKLNCLRLHLHAPYHDAQTLFESREALHARRTYPTLVQWAKSEIARKSVCYAGQLIRTARLSPEDTIRGPGAIMIYQATLVLIVYGVICGTSQEQSCQSIVRVDSCEDIGLQRFLQFGYGVPAIQGSSCLNGDLSNSTQVCLTDSSGIIEGIMEIFKTNYRRTRRPPIIHEVARLLNGVRISLANSD